MPRPRRTQAIPPTRGTADPEAAEGDQDRSAEAFGEFVRSMPEDARITTGLRRLPSYVHPQVTEPEHLPAPQFMPDLGQMQEEVRRRYGPGRYRLYVTMKNERGKTERFAGPVFFLAPTPAEEAGGEFLPEERERPMDPLDSALDKLGRAAETESKARAVAILQGKQQPEPAKTGLDEMRAWVEVLRAVMPQQPDAITLLKNLRDLIVPAGAQANTPDATLNMIEKTVSILQGLGGEGGARRSTTEVLVNGIVELARSWGPYLPAVVKAVAQVQQQVRAGGPVPPAVPQPPTPKAVEGPTADLLARAVGDDPVKQLALATLLNITFLEMQTRPPSLQDADDSYARVADFAEARMAGFCGDLVKMTPEQVWTLWVSLDARVQGLEHAGPWLTGFLGYLAAPAPSEEGGQDGR